MGLIQKKFTSETAHIVRNAVTKRCSENIHGHTFVWSVVIGGEINEETGMILDFKSLQPVKDFIDTFDHSTVFWNKEDTIIIEFFKANFKRVVITKKNPTAENMARLLLCFIDKWINSLNLKNSVYVDSVEIWETQNASATAFEYDENDVIIQKFISD
jgi:6-pyruvoyltetrahydropterin/6-carboxytetrahydropterin synthase